MRNDGYHDHTPLTDRTYEGSVWKHDAEGWAWSVDCTAYDLDREESETNEIQSGWAPTEAKAEEQMKAALTRADGGSQ